MAYVSRIGPSGAQVEYRLLQGVGCGVPAQGGAAGGEVVDAQVDYRAKGERPLRWIGAGCAEYGVVEGEALTDEDLDRARALMDGVDWQTGERLVPAKVEAAPAAKLPGVPLLDAVLLRAAETGVDPSELFASDRMCAAYRRLARGVQAHGEAYAMHVDLAGSLADAAGVDVLDTWGDAYLDALAHREERIDVRNRGYDLVQTLPKSFSVLMAYAPPWLAKELEEQVFDVAAQDTLRYVESVASYGMRGHHGDGRNAARMESSGFVGWSLVHRTSRAGDPHHHVHLTVANLVRGRDGQWSAVAAGGRDLMRHAHAMGAFMEARTRHLLHTRYGIAVARSEHSGQWEIVGVPESTVRLFSKRDREIRAFLDALGLNWAEATDGERRAARDATRDAKDPTTGTTDDDELRTKWQAEGRARGDDPEHIVAAVLSQNRTASIEVGVDAIAAQVFDPETGLTAHRKSFDRAAAFAVVLEQLEHGVPDAATAHRVVDAVLQRAGQVVALPATGPQYMSDIERYTTADLVAAEQTILTAANARRNEGTARVPVETAEMALATYEAGKGHSLSDEQRTAYLRLVTAGHGIDALIGVAGSGKTTIMEAARVAWQAAGYTVTGTAIAAVAAQNLQTETGIPSLTVAGLLQGHRPMGDVLVVDEAAMVDERRMAAIVAAAAHEGTKVVGVGDPKQLRAAGVGGSFVHVHAAVSGPTLTQNRRQRDPAECAVTALIRDGKFAPALRDWSSRDRVHVADTRAEALAALVLGWRSEGARYADPHDRLREVLMIAYTNADVAALNAGARALLQSQGQLPTANRTYRLTGGERLDLAVGDAVRVRQNLWAQHGRDTDLLNGHRGLVAEIRDDGSVVVERLRRDGQEALHSLVCPGEIARGALSHGYAITDHAAQGQTADVALVYPIGMDANAFYPAVTRHRDRVLLFVPLEEVEDDLTRLRLGEVRTAEERQLRAVDGLARTVRATKEEMVSLELLGQPPSSATSGDRFDDALVAVLGPALAERVRAAPERAALIAVLDRMEHEGHDVATVLSSAVSGRELSTARSPAAVLHHRLTAGLDRSTTANSSCTEPAQDRPRHQQTDVDTAPLRRVVEAAADYYAAQPAPEWVTGYLTGRGLRPVDLPARTGYAPPGWTSLVEHLRSEGFTDEDLLAAGVAARSSRGTLIDRMRDRLVLPIRDDDGAVAFIGRAEPDAQGTPKWLNTAETPLFRKGSLLYGLAENREALTRGAVPVLVEGPLDAAAITVAGGGRYIGVAPLGTSLTADHVRVLRDLVGEDRTVIVGFDGDAAGHRATTRAYGLLANPVADIRWIELADGSDPAEALGSAGPESLRRSLDTAGPLVDFVVEQRVEAWSPRLQWAEGRIGALREVAPIVAALPSNAATRQIGCLMARLDLPHDTVLDAVIAALPQAVHRGSDISPSEAAGRAAPPPARSRATTRRNRPGVEEHSHRRDPGLGL